jgi:hypothetical protein
MGKPGSIYRSFVAEFPEPKEGDLRFWWIPQVPMQEFEWPVASVAEAINLDRIFSAYDDFQFAHGVKGDYSNVGGLSIYRNGEWEDWEDEDGYSFDDVRLGRVPA